MQEEESIIDEWLRENLTEVESMTKEEAEAFYS